MITHAIQYFNQSTALNKTQMAAKLPLASKMLMTHDQSYLIMRVNLISRERESATCHRSITSKFILK